MIRSFVVVSLLSVVEFGLLADPVKLACWIVADNHGGTSHSESSMSNSVQELNKIFSQVAMSFEIESISMTNSTRLTNIDFTNHVQIAELCSITNQTGGLEIYFVESITGNANAFYVPSGIVVGPFSSKTALAHEIGHACGLNDIYEAYNRETTLCVTGMPCKAWLPRDWGWYPDNVTQVTLISRLLMYGYDTSTKGDISLGDVYGLSYEHVWNATSHKWDKTWHLGLIPVGFKNRGNRHPVSQ